jgi:hypothetical protein
LPLYVSFISGRPLQAVYDDTMKLCVMPVMAAIVSMLLSVKTIGATGAAGEFC